jgi:hypothetical protein
MEFLLVIALVAFGTRRYRGEKGVKPTMLNPGHYRDRNAFMVMYDLVMKEGRIKE